MKRCTALLRSEPIERKNYTDPQIMHMNRYRRQCTHTIHKHIEMFVLSWYNKSAEGTICGLFYLPTQVRRLLRDRVFPQQEHTANDRRRTCVLRELSNFFRRIRWEVLRRRVFERDRYICQYCGSNKDLAVDHVWPRSKGGKDRMNNLVTACKSCNSSKNGKTLREWIESKSGPVIQIQPTEPQKQVTQIRIVSNPSGDKKDEIHQDFDLPFPERLPELAQLALVGTPVSHTQFAGAGKLFSRSEFEELVESLVSAKLARWKSQRSRNAGIALTEDGIAAFRHISQLYG